VFVDESGFSLVPFLLRSWSPIGEPDIILESEKRAHLSSIGLVSLSPIRHRMKFFTTTFPGSAKSAEMSYVLDELHQHFRGKVILVWDNLQGHIGLQAKYERQHPGWFHFVRLPTYSPELNVVEQCWNQIKNVEIANFAPKNQKQVVAQVQLATSAINKNKTLLPNFLKHIKLKR
jgi:transposase